jgi:hypothetical protein
MRLGQRSKWPPRPQGFSFSAPASFASSADSPHNVFPCRVLVANELVASSEFVIAPGRLVVPEPLDGLVLLVQLGCLL